MSSILNKILKRKKKEEKKPEEKKQSTRLSRRLFFNPFSDLDIGRLRSVKKDSEQSN